MIKIRLAGFWRICFILFLQVLFINPAISVQSGGVQYSIPVDYSAINEGELNKEAEKLFQMYLNTDSFEQQRKLLEQMLSDYSILGEINNQNPLYFTRLGIVYDKLGYDRYAKANFFRSSNLIPNYPYAYYAFGNFYFDRQEYRKSLKLYQKAYNCGYNNHFYTIFQIGRIYEKLGDFSSAIKYYKQGLNYNDTDELRKRILELELLLNNNSIYNREHGVRK